MDTSVLVFPPLASGNLKDARLVQRKYISFKDELLKASLDMVCLKEESVCKAFRLRGHMSLIIHLPDG